MSAIPSPSLYEKLNLTPKIMRQRVVENFSGALLNERWNTTLESGTPTFAMSDTIDGGFETTMTTAAFNALKVNFNNRRQYDPNGCVSICIAKRDSNILQTTNHGFIDDLAITNRQIAIINGGSDFATYTIQTGDASTITFTAGTVARDLDYHLGKFELRTTVAEWQIDNVIQLNHSTSLPTVKLQPYFRHGKGNDAIVKVANWKYMECYNT